MRSRAVALAAVLALAAACTGSDGGSLGPSAPPTHELWRGGTLRLAFAGDAFEQLDPQREYYFPSWELFRCCLLRTLFSYNGLPASEGGAEARPDLADGQPEISADGLTWTIRVKPGIRYAPPLEDVEITAQDFVRALMREASPVAAVGYPFYYSVIRGFDAYASGDADTISGLETPDEHTLVVRLTEPAGDLPNRLAMAAAAPIPPNPYRPDEALGAAEGHDRYGPFLIASGPYMIEDSSDLDLSASPGEQEPVGGYTPTRYDEQGRAIAQGSLVLVRNPSWDPATDDLRAAYADRIEVQLGGALSGAYRADSKELSEAVEAGTLDHVLDLVSTRAQVRRYRSDPAMEGRVTTEPTGFQFYVLLNLAVPPFDDLHVRKAVAYAMDEAELVRTALAERTDFGFANQAVVATHIAPDDIEAGLLADYDPYPTSLELARREMALSGYDRDRDGRCDAPECRRVLALVRSDKVGPRTADVMRASLASIGVDMRIDSVSPLRFNPRIFDEREKVPFSMGFRYASDYPNASTHFLLLFASFSITEWIGNSSLLGASPSQLRRWGYDVTRVPSADDRIDRCMAMTGSAQNECWAELDRYLMDEVVAVIPYLASESTFVVSERVASWSHSVATTQLALDRIALAPGSE